MKKYHCVVCGLVYDEMEGWPQDGIAAETNQRAGYALIAEWLK